MSGTIKTNQFNDTIKGLTIFVEEKDKNGNIKNIFIRDESNIFQSINRGGNTKNLSIFANRGKIFENDGNFLILNDGTIHSEHNNGDIKSISFEKTRLNLQGMKAKSITKAKVQETRSEVLIKCLLSNKESKLLNCPSEGKIEVLSEMNRRLGMPLYIPFISLICSFLLINREEDKLNFFYKYFFGAISFVTLVLAEILVRYSGLSYTYSIIYFLIPLISMPILYLEIIRRFVYENLKNKKI